MTGLSVTTTISAYANPSLLTLKTDVQVGGNPLWVHVNRTGATTFDLYVYTSAEEELISFDVIAPQVIRFLLHDEFVTIYFDERWMYTFALEDVVYPETVTASLTANAAITCSEIRRQELYDWRDAIFVDMETVAGGAVQSVIQQRPVELRPKWDGALYLSYVPAYTSNAETLAFVRQMEESYEFTQGSFADGIVQGMTNEVVQSDTAIDHSGFATRVLRLPDLDSGAKRAAKTIQIQSIQSMYQIGIDLRPNLTIEPGDLVEYGGIQTIVEAVSYTLRQGQLGMQLKGRRNLDV